MPKVALAPARFLRAPPVAGARLLWQCGRRAGAQVRACRVAPVPNRARVRRPTRLVRDVAGDATQCVHRVRRLRQAPRANSVVAHAAIVANHAGRRCWALQRAVVGQVAAQASRAQPAGPETSCRRRVARACPVNWAARSVSIARVPQRAVALLFAQRAEEAKLAHASARSAKALVALPLAWHTQRAPLVALRAELQRCAHLAVSR